MSTTYVGQILLFAGNYAPTNFAFCNGQLLNVSQYPALFSIIGAFYGGDGRTTFALPNLQGSVPIGSGQGPGLSNYVLGLSAGSETVALTVAQMPSHTHQVSCGTGAGTSPLPSNAVWAQAPNLGKSAPYYGGAPNATMAAGCVSSTGSGTPHNNIQPSLVINYIIAVNGIFPSRN